MLAPRVGTLEFDNGYAGITSIYDDHGSGRLLGFYHAEDYEDIPRPPNEPDYQPGYWSIGVAVSDDHGNSFGERVQILTSMATRKDAIAAAAHRGIGDVCVVTSPDEQHLYAYYTDLTRRPGRIEDEWTRIGLARAPIASAVEPSAWKKYRDGRFDQAGLGGDESSVVSPPSGFRAEVLQPHVTRVAGSGRFVMVCCVHDHDEFAVQKILPPDDQTKAVNSGIWLWESEDGIHWINPVQLVAGLTNPVFGREYLAHPTIHLESICFAENVLQGWLLYGHTPRYGWNSALGWQSHHLVGCPIRLMREV